MLCFCSLQILLFNAICTADEFFGDHFVEAGYLCCSMSVNQSNGFSPFELVFGHSVCGPLKVLKEAWMSNEELTVNLLEYVATFKQRLIQARELARQNLKRTQLRMKVWYDKKSRE